MSDKDVSTLTPEATRCAACGARVGLLWYRGRSTLIEGPLRTDGEGRLVMRRHVCPGRARPREPGDDPDPADGGGRGDREPRGRPGECRGCQARIYWVQGIGHKWRPTNADGSGHFGTCPEANKFRGAKG